MKASTVTILEGDVLKILGKLPPKHFRTCVTSPPYWGLRDYGVSSSTWSDIQFHPVVGLSPFRVIKRRVPLGRENDLWSYIGHLVAIFRKVRPLLTDDGTLWLNLGDSYSSGGRTGYALTTNRGNRRARGLVSPPFSGLPPKNLCGVPWRVAFALQADGWYLRSDIIWQKPNPMPESVGDRPTKAHEYLFLFSKSKKYFYDEKAIREPARDWGLRDRKAGSAFVDGTPGRAKQNGCKNGNFALRGRNRRSVWTIATKPIKEAHFATFPPDLVTPCILAGSHPGDHVFDPFGGSGTTGMVSRMLGRHCTLIDLNFEYAAMARRRCAAVPLEEAA